MARLKPWSRPAAFCSYPVLGALLLLGQAADYWGAPTTLVIQGVGIVCLVAVPLLILQARPKA